MSNRCIECRFFDNDPSALETAFPGFNTLSSAYGSVRGDSGTCSLHDQIVSFWKNCGDFTSQVPGSAHA